MISDETYAIYRAAVDKANAWIVDRIGSGSGSWKTSDEPDYVRDVTNEIRAEVEEYEIHRDKPRLLTLYVDGPSWEHCNSGTLTGWTGIPYGTFKTGKRWTDRHNGLRVQITATLPGIGTYTGQWSTVHQCVNLRKSATFHHAP